MNGVELNRPSARKTHRRAEHTSCIVSKAVIANSAPSTVIDVDFQDTAHPSTVDPRLHGAGNTCHLHRS
jgi:hypothetical protein